MVLLWDGRGHACSDPSRPARRGEAQRPPRCAPLAPRPRPSGRQALQKIRQNKAPLLLPHLPVPTCQAPLIPVSRLPARYPERAKAGRTPRLKAESRLHTRAPPGAYLAACFLPAVVLVFRPPSALSQVDASTVAAGQRAKGKLLGDPRGAVNAAQTLWGPRRDAVD